jgi:hypothetical protein
VAAELKKALNVDAVLAVGDPGELTVWLDGAKVIEKTTMRFPEPPEIIAAIRARGAS